jgi:NADP-dependent 3-hydroxy acid dehydrogenase YdfG
MCRKIILITGASSGFGALTARALADADGGTANTVYAGMRATTGRNAPQVQAAKDYSAGHGVDLRAIELDVNFQDSVDAAVQQILGEQDRIDVLIHNAGHMVVGPAEAFTPEQLAERHQPLRPRRPSRRHRSRGRLRYEVRRPHGSGRR